MSCLLFCLPSHSLLYSSLFNFFPSTPSFLPTIFSSSLSSFLLPPLPQFSCPPHSLSVCTLRAIWLGNDRLWPLVECRRRRRRRQIDWEQAADDKWANCFRLTMECLPACQAYSLLLSRQHHRGREAISNLSHATILRSENVSLALHKEN